MLEISREVPLGAITPAVLPEEDQHLPTPAPASEGGFVGGGEEPPGRPTAVGAKEPGEEERTPRQLFGQIWTKSLPRILVEGRADQLSMAVSGIIERLEKVLEATILSTYAREHLKRIADVALMQGARPTDLLSERKLDPDDIFDKSAWETLKVEERLLDHYKKLQSVMYPELDSKVMEGTGREWSLDIEVRKARAS